MGRDYDVIVVGLGGMGSAAAAELARRGNRVLGIEQFAMGHDRGSSHGRTRVIRKGYFEHPDYVPLVLRSYELWRALEASLQRPLLTTCACVSIGPPRGELIEGVRRAAAAHGLGGEDLSAAELARRFPGLRFSDAYVGWVETDAGHLAVEACVEAHQEKARRHGAVLRDNEPVVSWEARPGSIVVRTGKDAFVADRLVITAGPWAGRALSELSLPLAVRRKVVLWFRTSEDRLYRPGRFPIFMADVPEGIFYGLPILDEDGVKIAKHDGGEPVADPSRVNRTITEADEVECRKFLRSHLPAVDGPIAHALVCLYTMTPDGHFIVDRHPAHANVVIAAGFSGHGFKFSPVVGEALADLTESGTTRLPISLFRLDRFLPPPHRK